MKRMARFSFLLPFRFNDGIDIPVELFQEVQTTLANKFNGVTYQRNPQYPIKGLWLSPGDKRVIPDDLMLYYVWTEAINEAREYFTQYKKALMEKFQQQELPIIEETIEVI